MPDITSLTEVPPLINDVLIEGASVEVKKAEKLLEVLERSVKDVVKEETDYAIRIQGAPGNWDYDPYMHGMMNGMLLIQAIVERKTPIFKEAPQEWGKDKEDKHILVKHIPVQEGN